MAGFPFVCNDVCALLMGHFNPLPLGEGAVVQAKRATNAGEGKIMTSAGHSERSEEAHKSYYIPSFKCRHSVLDTKSQSLSKENPSRTSLGKGNSIDNELVIAEQVRNDENSLTSSLPALHKSVAFTLAEVLITLGIIGVVAAMTIPTLIQKHQKQVTVNKLKKVYSTLSQMVIRTYADNGAVSDFLTSSDVVDADKTKEFFDTYWLPYFNAPIVANPTFYSKSTPFSYMNGKEWIYGVHTGYHDGRILFSTQDGTIYHVNTMDWERDDEGNNLGIARYSTRQAVYADINGAKGPNVIGKDIFIFEVNFDNNVVRSSCSSFSIDRINQNCSKSSSGSCCAAKIINDGWQIKDDYPW